MLGLRSAIKLVEQQLGQATFATQAMAADFTLALKGASDLLKTADIPAASIGLTSGMPLELMERKVRIYIPARTPSQQGQAKTMSTVTASPTWKIEFESQGKWVNQLMGWTSSADVMENVSRSTLFFNTKEEAISFATKHGWTYEIEEPNRRRETRQKRYADYAMNFRLSAAAASNAREFQTCLPYGQHESSSDVESAPVRSQRYKIRPLETLRFYSLEAALTETRDFLVALFSMKVFMQ